MELACEKAINEKPKHGKAHFGILIKIKTKPLHLP